MFDVEASSIVESLWDNLRPSEFGGNLDHNGAEPGIIVTMDLRMEWVDSDWSFHRSALIHTLLTANTTVFTTVSREYDRWESIPHENWYNSSNHDSCWRSDGLQVFANVFFDFAKELNADLALERKKEVAPKDFNQFCRLGFLGHHLWTFVTVKHEKIGENDRPAWNDRAGIISIKKKES